MIRVVLGSVTVLVGLTAIGSLGMHQTVRPPTPAMIAIPTLQDVTSVQFSTQMMGGTEAPMRAGTVQGTHVIDELLTWLHDSKPMYDEGADRPVQKEGPNEVTIHETNGDTLTIEVAANESRLENTFALIPAQDEVDLSTSHSHKVLRVESRELYQWLVHHKSVKDNQSRLTESQ